MNDAPCYSIVKSNEDFYTHNSREKQSDAPTRRM